MPRPVTARVMRAKTPRVPAQIFRLICALAVLLFADLSAAEPESPPLREQIEQALAKGDLVHAEALLTKGLTVEPAPEELLSLRADLEVRQGRLAVALQQIEALRRRDPKSVSYRLREAQYLSWLGRLQSASAAYDLLLKDFPENHDARTGLGLTLSWRGDWHGARNEFAAVLKAQPENSLAFQADLRARLALGDASGAFRDAMARDHKTGETDAELGLLLANIISRIDAGSLAETFATRPTTDLDLQLRQITFRAHRQIARGRHERGLALIRNFSEAHPRDYSALVEVANAYAAADQRTAARAYFERAIAITPERAEAPLGLARLSSREGSLNRSVDALQELVEGNPENIEGWLGLVRAAMLAEDFDKARRALIRAEDIAPHSALVREERLKLDLATADTNAFENELHKLQLEQPDYRSAFLWQQRWLQAQHKPLDRSQLSAHLDALAPEMTGLTLRLLLANGEIPSSDISKWIPAAPSADLQPFANAALGRQLALLLEFDQAIEVAKKSDPAESSWIEILASGWWAYVATPFTGENKSAGDAGFSSMVVWRTGELQKRLRTMQTEAESPLFEEWLLCRAFWFQTWRGKWDSAEAIAALDEIGRSFLPAAAGATHARIQEAWRASEQPLPPELDAFPEWVTRARWQEYRRAYPEAIQLWERVAEKYPDAVEPRQRRAIVMRLAGRWDDAQTYYERLEASGQLGLLMRLDYAELLRRRGEFSRARQQYRKIEAAGFDEAELYLGDAELAEALWNRTEARRWFDEGLRRHPESPTLRSEEARLLLRQNDRTGLAVLVSSEEVPSWLDYELLTAARPALSEASYQRIVDSPQWWFSWQWLPPEQLARHARTIAPPSPGAFDIATGYEYSFLHNTTTNGGTLPNWQEAFLAVAWHQSELQSFYVDFHWYERFGGNADQMNFAWARGWMKDWLVHLDGGVGLSGSFIPEWRAGGGASYRFSEQFFAHLDFNYLAFEGIDVAQAVPGLTWRVTPHLSLDGRVYIARNHLDTGANDQSFTYFAAASWEFHPDATLRLQYSGGDENAADLNRNLIGEGNFQSVGAYLRLSRGPHWAIQPGYRFEHHEQFNLQAVSLTLHYAF